MAAGPHLSAATLAGKVIDIHSHLGFSLKSYARLEYPYGQDLEGLYYRQVANGVDVNVVFPLSADLFFEPSELLAGNVRPARKPLSPVPFGTENRMVLREVFEYCPELKDRFLPFLCVDPGRKVREQIAVLEELRAAYPVYGLKVNPVILQSRVAELLAEGGELLEFARRHRLPMLFHMSSDLSERYSDPEAVFAILEQNPDLRFCLAHCLNFDKLLLEQAAGLPNVWIDTAALKIQVQMYHDNDPKVRPAARRFDADYSDHRRALRSLVEAYPERILWGTDSPAYAYICRRKQAEGQYREYRLKGRHEDEKAALDALPGELKWKICNENSLRFLFGQTSESGSGPPKG
jgi:predicted TIM-barrel fold metal-dependent hydrolase